MCCPFHATLISEKRSFISFPSISHGNSKVILYLKVAIKFSEIQYVHIHFTIIFSEICKCPNSIALPLFHYIPPVSNNKEKWNAGLIKNYTYENEISVHMNSISYLQLSNISLPFLACLFIFTSLFFYCNKRFIFF